eukprot:4630627-Prymnesium_polylepis.1
MEAGSLAAALAQVAALQQYIEEKTHAPFDPVAAGVLTARTAEAKKRTRDKTRIEESGTSTACAPSNMRVDG